MQVTLKSGRNASSGRQMNPRGREADKSKLVEGKKEAGKSTNPASKKSTAQCQPEGRPGRSTTIGWTAEPPKISSNSYPEKINHLPQACEMTHEVLSMNMHS